MPANAPPNTTTTATTTKRTPSKTKPRKRKRKHHSTATPQPRLQTTLPLPRPQHLYLALDPIRSPPSTTTTTLDEPTLRLHLLSALSTYLGDHGAAIPIDILSVPAATGPLEIVIRVPWADGAAFMAALASWPGGSAPGAVAGYVVRAHSGWLAEVVGTREMEVLFDFGAGEGLDGG